MKRRRLPLSALTVLLAAILVASCAGCQMPSGNSKTASPDASLSVSGTPAVPVPFPSVTPLDGATLFLSRYSWIATAYLGSLEVVLPDSLVTSVEDSPLQFYWMQAAILSGDIGLDLKAYLGQSVSVRIYSVTGVPPEKYSHPAMTNTRGIVFRDGEGRILGAHIDAGASGVSYSLKGRDVAAITGFGLAEYWKQNYYSLSDPVNAAASGRTADQVIRRYFEGMAAGDRAKQLSTLCVGLKLNALYVNLDSKLPWNMVPELYGYLVGVQVLSVEKYPAAGSGGVTVYEVRIDAKLTDMAKEVLEHDGPKTRYVGIGEENGLLRVFSDGTGP